MTCLVCGEKMTLFINGLFDDRYGAPGRHDIYRCKRCGFGRISPGLSPSSIGKFYATYYPLAKMMPQSVKAAVSLPPKWRAWLTGTNNIAHHYIKPGEKVLDIGSASGVSLLEIQAMGGNAYGVEPDPNAAKLANELGLKVQIGFITDNPFPREKFDFITASQVIEHTPDPKAFLQSASAKLKPGGQMVLSFPNIDALYRKIFGRRWLHWHIPYHYNFFTRDSFERLALSVGLTVVTTKTITPNLWTLIQLRMIAGQPEEGKMGSIWAAQHGQRLTGHPRSMILNHVRDGGLKVVSALISLANRTVDRAGQGESFLVFLKSKNSS